MVGYAFLPQTSVRSNQRYSRYPSRERKYESDEPERHANDPSRALRAKLTTGAASLGRPYAPIK